MSKAMNVTTPPTPTTMMQVPHEKIAMRAYEKWCKRGKPKGSEKQDWLEAEAEIRMEMSRMGSSTPQMAAAQRR
jgi:Protein of unknown function (DUF2934)